MTSRGNGDTFLGRAATIMIGGLPIPFSPSELRRLEAELDPFHLEREDEPLLYRRMIEEGYAQLEENLRRFRSRYLCRGAEEMVTLEPGLSREGCQRRYGLSADAVAELAVGEELLLRRYNEEERGLLLEGLTYMAEVQVPTRIKPLFIGAVPHASGRLTRSFTYGLVRGEEGFSFQVAFHPEGLEELLHRLEKFTRPERAPVYVVKGVPQALFQPERHATFEELLYDAYLQVEDEVRGREFYPMEIAPVLLTR